MGLPDDAGAAEGAVYDVQLLHRPASSLWSRYPSVVVHTTGSQTALLPRVDGPGQLDTFLDTLRSLGLVLVDLHRLSASEVPTQTCPAGTHRESGVYEVRVSGELGDPLLRYLRWPHFVVPEQTRVRICAGATELHGFLQACTEAGSIIERVRRVDVAPAREPSPA